MLKRLGWTAKKISSNAVTRKELPEGVCKFGYNFKNIHTMDEIDLQIVKAMAKGMKQYDIAQHFKTKGITPNSVSIIEKRLRKVREEYHAKTNFHLAVILKGRGLI